MNRHLLFVIGFSLTIIGLNAAHRPATVDSIQCIKTFKGHSDSVHSVAFSPDSKLVAAGSKDSFITLWNVDSQQLHDKLKGHSGSISQIIFSPDGTMLASAGSDGVIIWSVQTKEILYRHKHDEFMYFIDFSPDSSMLAFFHFQQENISVLDIKSKTVVSVTQDVENMKKSIMYKSWMCTNKVSHNGKVRVMVEGACPPKISLINADKTENELGYLLGHAGLCIHSFEFSPDNTLLATGGSDGTLKLWNLKSLMQQTD